MIAGAFPLSKAFVDILSANSLAIGQFPTTFLSIKNKVLGVGELSQREKCLLHKDKGWNLSLSTDKKVRCSGTHACDYSAREIETGG